MNDRYIYTFKRMHKKRTEIAPILKLEQKFLFMNNVPYFTVTEIHL